jgi:hypothetical protein
LTVKRWKRYGHDRLYVSDREGARVGWLDLQTGALHLELPALASQFDAALLEHFGVVQPPAPVAPPLPRQPSSAVMSPIQPVPAVQPWQDLAGNVPGQQARHQAQARRDAAPVRTSLARVLGVHTDERAWRVGARGEEKVAGQLEKLVRRDGRWCFVNAIPVGDRGSDIDHLLIGPAGVFTLNAKHHPGKKVWVGGDTMLVGGHRVPYVRNARHEAQRASRLLSAAVGVHVQVGGVVVPVGADDFVVKSQPVDVHVVNRMRLLRWLTDLPDVLPPELVGRLFAAARRSTTWRSQPGR